MEDWKSWVGRLEAWKIGYPSFLPFTLPFQSVPSFQFLPFKKLFWLLFPLLGIALFTLANWCFPLPKTRLHPPPSRIVLDRNGEWLRAFLAEDGMWRFSSHQSPVTSHQLRRGSTNQIRRFNRYPIWCLPTLTRSDANNRGQMVLLPLRDQSGVYGNCPLR